MSYPVKPHLPLITSHIEFQLNHLLPMAPAITLYHDLGHLRDQCQTCCKTSYHCTRICTPNPDTEGEVSNLANSELSKLLSIYNDNQPTVKILKPLGEAEQKNCGGFSLEKALGWEQVKYNELMVSVCLIPVIILRVTHRMFEEMYQ